MPDDRTARARIRDAALAEFAERGVAGTSIRAVAARAGVSPALVQHHFRTKDGLRAACDAHVLDYLRAQTRAGLDEGRIGDPAFTAHVYDTAPPLMRYLARALVDGSPAAAAVFDEAVALTERYLVDAPGLSDPHTRAVVYTAMRLGVIVLRDHVERGLGEDPLSAAARVGRATLDITAPQLLPDGLADRVRDALGVQP
jgi:AcrR family transcriptional regulator